MILPLMGLVTALVSKSCTTLSASSFEDVSSVSGSHSLSEAMYLASLSLLRLISANHCVSLLTLYDEGCYPVFRGNSPLLTLAVSIIQNIRAFVNTNF